MKKVHPPVKIQAALTQAAAAASAAEEQSQVNKQALAGLRTQETGAAEAARTADHALEERTQAVADEGDEATLALIQKIT